MKRRNCKIILSLGLLAVAGFALHRAAHEPSADGRILTEWLRLGRENQARRDNTDVTNAVRKIGADGIPLLLNKLRAQDPAWKRRLREGWGERVFSYHWLHAAQYETMDAHYGFSILGTQAVAAIPALSHMLFDTNVAVESGYALGLIGPEALPALRAALTNENRAIWSGATYGMTATPAMARAAMPEILALPRMTNGHWISYMVLSHLPQVLPEEELLPVAKEYLRAGPVFQMQALNLLVSVRTNAARTAPLVIPYLEHPDSSVRDAARNALRNMDPPTATALDVNSNAAKAP